MLVTKLRLTGQIESNFTAFDYRFRSRFVKPQSAYPQQKHV